MAPTLMNDLATSLVDEFSVFDLTVDNKKSATEVLINGSVRLDHSLRGFDPMLELSESRDDQGPWNAEEYEDAVMNDYPSLACASSLSYDVIPRSSIELRELAVHLAKEKPRALTKEEEIEITLGESTKDSSAKSERKAKEKASKESSTHSTPKTKERKQIVVVTPSQKPEKRKSLRHALSSKLSPKPKIKKTASTISPTTNKSSLPSTPSKSPALKRLKSVSKLSTISRRKSSVSSASDLDIPTLAKPNPTSFLKDGSIMALKTSEQDPSPHQVALPTSQDLFVHSKLCSLLDSYEKLDKKFDFNDFCGVNLQVLNDAALQANQDVAGMTPVHKVLLQQLLSCAEDISVEGFFTHGQDKERSRVGIFSTQSSSHFIVVYRGTTEQQLRPARVSSKSMAANLDPTDKHTLPVYSPVRDAYFDMETKVYKRLDQLMEQNPFSHVVFVGHSFAGALATIGAVRFASARPTQRFSCHTFGSPKVGAHDFRNMVNTLPNLKIMRVEYGSDPNTYHPADVGSLKWEHVGHTVAIHGAVGVVGKVYPNHPVLAYRFDNKKPSTGLLQQIPMGKNSIQHYVGAIEPFATKQLPWVESYAGEGGVGVRGKDNEKRLMV